MNSDTHLITYLAIATWLFVIVLDWFGLIPLPLVSPVVVALYTVSCLGLHLLHRGGMPLPSIIPWAGALVLAWCLFVFYGALLDGIQLQHLVEAPSRTGLSLLFVNGAVAAIVASAVLAYPLAVIYGRRAGIMAVVVAMSVFAYSAPGLLEADFGRLSSTVMALEMVWLYVALLTVPQMVLRALTSRVLRDNDLSSGK